MLAGVASGMAEYFEVDPTLIRVLWLISIFFGGLGIFAYIVLAIIMPLEPEVAPTIDPSTADATAETPGTTASGWHSPAVTHRHVTRDNGRIVTFAGLALILFGALALVGIYLPDLADGGRFLWPAFVLGIGVLLVAGAVRRDTTPP
jgi:phage shock protein PspC (stress-responsive transcriptional regulator)